MTAIAPRLQRASGECRVAFDLRDGQTRLGDLYQRDPCRVLFPKPELGEPPQAVLLTTSGGVTDGDSLENGHRDRPRRGGRGDDPGGREDLSRRQGRRPLRHRRRRARGRGRLARLAAAGDHRLPGRAAQAPHRGRRRARRRLARLRDGGAGPRRLGRALRLGPAARTPGRCAAPAGSPGRTRCGSRARRRTARASARPMRSPR